MSYSPTSLNVIHYFTQFFAIPFWFWHNVKGLFSQLPFQIILCRFFEYLWPRLEVEVCLNVEEDIVPERSGLSGLLTKKVWYAWRRLGSATCLMWGQSLVFNSPNPVLLSMQIAMCLSFHHSSINQVRQPRKNFVCLTSLGIHFYEELNGYVLHLWKAKTVLLFVNSGIEALFGLTDAQCLRKHNKQTKTAIVKQINGAPYWAARYKR